MLVALWLFRSAIFPISSLCLQKMNDQWINFMDGDAIYQIATEMNC